MFGLSMGHLLVVLVVALLLFGNKLPDMARWFGKTLADFKKETDDVMRDLRSPDGR